MTSPLTPTVRRGTLAMGDVFSDAFATYRARVGLFVALVAAPIAAVFLVAVLAGIAFAVIAAGAARTGPTPAQWGLLAVVGVLAVVGLFLASLYQYRCLAMTSVAALDLAEGQEPTWANLTERTRGFMGRMFVLLLAAFAVVIALYTIIILVTVAPLAMAGRTPRDTQILAAMGGLVLIAAVVGVIAVVLTVRWLYLIPVMGAERRSGFAALGRSWSLTRGDFWRTLGYYLVMSIVVAIPLFVLQIVAQVLVMPLAALTGWSGTPSSQQTVALVVGGVLYGLLTAAVSILVTPYSAIFVALMYLSRVRQSNGEPPAVAYYQQPIGGWQQPGAPGQPGAVPHLGGYQQAGGYPQPGAYQQPGATPPASPFGQPTSAQLPGASDGYPATPSYGPPGAPAPQPPQAWPPAPPATAPEADDEGPTARQ